MSHEGRPQGLERCRSFPGDWREWRRLRAWDLKQRGWSQRDIAEAFGVTEAAISRWMAAARQGGPAALLASPSPGAAPRLTDQDYQALEELLAKGATAYGWPNNLWTAGRVAQIIQQRFGVRYHPGHVSRLLRRQLNWTCQRPEHHHKDRNDAAIARWVSESFPSILEKATAKRSHLVFVDEAGFMLEPIVRRTWAPRGETPVHRIGNPHSRISAIGAITITPSRGRIGLLYGLLEDNQNYHGPTVVQFLRKLRSTLRGSMTVIWDQIPIHECEEVDEYVAEGHEIVVEPFPPHAPELNPADGIWRYVKFGRLANYTPSDLGVLRAKVIQELDQLRGRSELLKSFVRFTKLPIDL
jgi:transposase